MSKLSLSIDLFEPGMDLFFRAGLAGLVSTLDWIDRNVASEDRPDGTWSHDDRRLTIEALDARAFLNRLYEISFQIDSNGMFYFPGKFPYDLPRMEVRAILHKALLSTYFMHMPSTCGGLVKDAKGKPKPKMTVTYVLDDDKNAILSYPVFSKLELINKYKDLLTKKGVLSTKPIEYASSSYPGAFKTHQVYKNTGVSDTAAHVLCLHFSIVACLSLCGPRKKVGDKMATQGVLVVPEIDNLNDVSDVIDLMIPSTIADCYVGGCSDAAFQTEVKLRLLKKTGSVPGCVGITFDKKPWNEKMLVRDAIVRVEPDNHELEAYESIMANMPVRHIKIKKEGNDSYFFITGVCRTLFANNMASGRIWYYDYHKLLSDKDKKKSANYEHKELKMVIDKQQGKGLLTPCEVALREIINEALHRNFGKLGSNSNGNKAKLWKDIERLQDRLQREWIRAGSSQIFQNSFVKFASEVGHLESMKKNLELAWSFVRDDWRGARNFSLIALSALSAYQSPVSQETVTEPATKNGE